jgi:Mg2+ and Co2+ transporter CorA
MYHYAVNNDNNIKKIAIIFLGVVFTIVSNIVIFGLNLEEAEHIFSIIGSLSIGVAIAAYFYQKRRDDLLSSID